MIRERKHQPFPGGAFFFALAIFKIVCYKYEKQKENYETTDPFIYRYRLVLTG